MGRLGLVTYDWRLRLQASVNSFALMIAALTPFASRILLTCDFCLGFSSACSPCSGPGGRWRGRPKARALNHYRFIAGPKSSTVPERWTISTKMFLPLLCFETIEL